MRYRLPRLPIFPGYSIPRLKYEQLLRGMSFEKFLSGAVPSLFHGEWDGSSQLSNSGVTNHSLRDNSSDGYHIKALVLFEQLGLILTDSSARHSYQPVPPESRQ